MSEYKDFISQFLFFIISHYKIYKNRFNTLLMTLLQAFILTFIAQWVDLNKNKKANVYYINSLTKQ